MTFNGSGDLLKVEDLKVYFPIKSGLVFDRHVGDVKAVDGLSFEIKKGRDSRARRRVRVREDDRRQNHLAPLRTDRGAHFL